MQVCQPSGGDDEDLKVYVTETVPMVVFSFFSSPLAFTLIKILVRLPPSLPLPSLFPASLPPFLPPSLPPSLPISLSPLHPLSFPSLPLPSYLFQNYDPNSISKRNTFTYTGFTLLVLLLLSTLPSLPYASLPPVRPTKRHSSSCCNISIGCCSAAMSRSRRVMTSGRIWTSVSNYCTASVSFEFM